MHLHVHRQMVIWKKKMKEYVHKGGGKQKFNDFQFAPIYY